MFVPKHKYVEMVSGIDSVYCAGNTFRNSDGILRDSCVSTAGTSSIGVFDHRDRVCSVASIK